MQQGDAVLQLNRHEDGYTLSVEYITESTIPDTLNGESGFHIYHVRTLTEYILRELKNSGRCDLTDADIQHIAVASGLHDVGKWRIPQSILDFPGKLSPVQYDIVKKHAQFGADMISETDFGDQPPAVKRHAYDIARYHHERYDGTGYPDGLAGEDIPLAAQVVALADSYDALTSSRSYKDAFSQDVAIQMISSGMCGIFDERLVECLMRVVNHSALVSLRDTLDRHRAVASTTVGYTPERVLCIGNTEYLTEEFINATFPDSKVTVVGNTALSTVDKIKLFRIKKPSVKAVIDTYDFDVVVYFSGDLTFRTTEKSDAEDLRELLEAAKDTGKEMKILFLSSLDSSFTERTDRAILCAAKEHLCDFYSKNSSLDIKTVQIPYLYSGVYGGDFLHKIFDDVYHHRPAVVEEMPASRMHFISLADLSRLVARIVDNWKCRSGILTVGDDFNITYADLDEAVRAVCEDARLDFTGTAVSGTLTVNNKGLRNEYGWFARTSMLDDLAEEYERYVDAQRERAQTVWQKLRQWIDRHGVILRVAELVLLLLVTELLLYITDSAVIFSIVDFRMAYIVIMATVHGLTYGLSAAALSSVSWLVAKVASGTNLLTVFYEPTNWLAFVLFFLVGAVCGYVKLRQDDTIRFVTEQNTLLEDKLVFTREIYEDTYQEKRDLKKQIIGSKDSFGKIFDITRKLDTVAPQQLYLRIMETFEEVLENTTITVYSVNSQSAFGRLEVASRDIINTVSRSISTDTYRPVIDKIAGGEIWRNTDLAAEYPMYAAGVYRGEELKLLIFLWRADLDQRSLYYVNLFKILRDLVQMSLLRAFDYNQAVYERQYIEHTHIMTAEAFEAVLADYRALADKKVSTYVLLELDGKGRSYEEIDRLIAGKVRANDFVGAADDGRCRLLFSQATERDLPYILPRFEGLDFDITIG